MPGANSRRRYSPTAPPSVLPDISPTRREIARSSRLSPIASMAWSAAALKLPISPLVGEMPGRAEGGAKECNRRLLRNNLTRSTSPW
ncbi:hypothetical protein FJ964_16615 [Mesorhizobium sp. B2-3-2]|nr:hypothetical protein FJ964_16615 [Mesorhizobium sp. B2-3-2]